MLLARTKSTTVFVHLNIFVNEALHQASRKNSRCQHGQDQIRRGVIEIFQSRRLFLFDHHTTCSGQNRQLMTVEKLTFSFHCEEVADGDRRSNLLFHLFKK